MKFLLNILIFFSVCNLFATDSTLVYAKSPTISSPTIGNNGGTLNIRTTGSALSAEEIDSLKVDFKVEKSRATARQRAQILYIERWIEDSTGVVDIKRIPIKDSVSVLNFIALNIAHIDSTNNQITTELDRLNQMTEINRQQNEQIRMQRQALVDRRRVDNQTRRELILLRSKL